MASPGSPDGHHQAGSETNREHEHKYRATAWRDSLPTKVGHEQSAYPDSKRPVSQSTANGTEYDFEKCLEADECVLARNTADPGGTDVWEPGLADSGLVTTYCAEPNISDCLATNELFQFSRPSRQPVRFNVLEVDQEHANQDQASQNKPSDRGSSPREQLRDDLDTIAQDHQDQINESSATLAHGSQNGAGQPRTASLIVDTQDLGQHQYEEAHIYGHQAGHTSAQVGSVRGQKKKKKQSKSSSKTSYATQTRPSGSDEWQVADYGNLFVLKVREYEQAQQARDAASASKREALQVELQHLVEARATIQCNLDNVLTENGRLTTTVAQQKQKIATYENKFQGFKKFIDGVGKDIDAIRKDANAMRRRSDDIIAEAAGIEGRILRQSNTAEVNRHIEHCQKIKSDAVKLAREKDEELYRAIVQRDSLQQQLSDSVGLLCEQRDRCGRLERQLQQQPDNRIVDGLNLNQKNHNAMLDKLHLIHAAVEQSKGDAVKTIEQLRSAVEAVKAPADTTSVKALVEALDEKLNSNTGATETTEASIRQHFDEAMQVVVLQLTDREKLIEDHRNIVSVLQERLDASNGRIANEEAQKTTAIEQVDTLRQQNAALHTNIAALQSKTSPENAPAQANKTELELEKTMTTLNAAQAELESKTEQLKTLTQINNSLGDQTKALKDRLQDIEGNNTESIPTPVFEEKMKEAELKTRKEMGAQFERFEVQLKTTSHDQLRDLNEKKIKPLENEVASYKQQVIELQKYLDEATSIASRSNAGLEALKTSCDDAIDAAHESNERKLDTLQNQLSETQTELQTAKKDNEMFFEGVEQSWKDEQQAWERKLVDATKTITDLEASKTEAQAGYESLIQQLRVDLDQQRNSMQEENEKLQAQLRAAKQKTQNRQRPSSKASQSSSRKHVPCVSDGKASSAKVAKARSKQARASKKSIDRTKIKITQTGPIQTPEELSPDSFRTNSANSNAATKGPEVEETQFEPDPFAAHQSQVPTIHFTQDSFSSLVYNQDGSVKDDQLHPGSQEIPETQPPDSLPTFAAINSSLRPVNANVPPFSSIPSELTSAPHPSDSATNELPTLTTVDEQHGHCDDPPNEQSGRQSTHFSSNHQIRPWSPEEKEKYMYQQSGPQPNSNSKRTPTIQPPGPIERRESGTGSRADLYKTPTLDLQASNELGKRMPSSSSNASDPAFIKDAHTSRRFNTYSTAANSGGQQRPSQTGSELIQDPRLVGRNQPTETKRKATGQVVEGYEQERKRRLAVNAPGKESESHTGGQHPQSINDLPSSSGGTIRKNSQTHMQTFGGGNSRTTRRTTRQKGADEMSARFTQELQRRR